MTDNEIVKALECCVSEKKGCKGCPYEVDGCLLDGTNKLLKDILALINRQKAEIAKLEKVEKYADETIKAQAAEIERLKGDLEYQCDSCKNIQLSRQEYWKAISQARSEAIKQFVEKVETELDERVSENIRNRNPHWYIAKRIVRETAIEMTEVSGNGEV